MCKELCDPETGESQSCVNCQRLICWDFESNDDVCAIPGVTSSSDLYCAECAARFDREEEEAEEAEEEYCEGIDYDPYDDPRQYSPMFDDPEDEEDE